MEGRVMQSYYDLKKEFKNKTMKSFHINIFKESLWSISSQLWPLLTLDIVERAT